MKLRLLLLLCLLIKPISTHANDLEGYVPPPLFGGGEDVQKTLPDDVKAPAPKLEPKNIIKPVQKPRTNFAKPLATEEPKSKPIIIEKVESKEIAVEAPPIIEEKQQGVVKGPKTMPAVKKQGVEAEVIFTPEHKNPAPMLKPAPVKEVKEIKQEKAKTPAPLSEETLWNLDFDAVSESLSSAQKDIILTQIIPHLDANGKASLQIESFAFSGAGAQSLNQDRRVALNRALAVRGYLLENEITSSRIDVRTMPTNSNNPARNQVEIQLVE